MDRNAFRRPQTTSQWLDLVAISLSGVGNLPRTTATPFTGISDVEAGQVSNMLCRLMQTSVYILPFCVVRGIRSRRQTGPQQIYFLQIRRIRLEDGQVLHVRGAI
ncbi:hypothetical protein N7510_004622 [Penicillium lagena]|uniref:uncharacterized protein n=1 Tax=Penicillium lagena TaxID=94218 RepID=UPI0025404B18|nr:uncharacterized protein N7510_004622 [Penicillium lagena]KAJ5620638.1 hypothetical protein N7510_004622 [Penicillium lagena]